jgi:hypothetical protein
MAGSGLVLLRWPNGTVSGWVGRAVHLIITPSVLAEVETIFAPLRRQSTLFSGHKGRGGEGHLGLKPGVDFEGAESPLDDLAPIMGT